MNRCDFGGNEFFTQLFFVLVENGYSVPHYVGLDFFFLVYGNTT